MSVRFDQHAVRQGRVHGIMELDAIAGSVVQGWCYGILPKFQPLITAKGLSLTTFCVTRAASSTSTTSATSL